MSITTFRSLLVENLLELNKEPIINQINANVNHKLEKLQKVDVSAIKKWLYKKEEIMHSHTQRKPLQNVYYVINIFF